VSYITAMATSKFLSGDKAATQEFLDKFDVRHFPPSLPTPHN
jgi:hypothetical protein